MKRILLSAFLLSFGCNGTLDHNDSPGTDAGEFGDVIDDGDEEVGSGDRDDDVEVGLRVEVIAGPDAHTTETSAELQFICFDGADCAFLCSLNGEDSEPCESPVDYEGLDDGDHIFEVVASVAAQTARDTWEWTVDRSAPEIAILEAPPATTSATSASVEFECTNRPDCLFECALHIDGQTGDWEQCSSPRELQELEPGSYELFIRATDGQGEQAEESVQWTVIVPDGWQISAGAEHTCGVRADGTLWCWGNGSRGRLGLDSHDHRDRPTQVGTSQNWVSVASGGNHTCGVRDDHSLWCWGRNRRGQLGHGDDVDRDVPEQVGTLTNWRAVATGGAHTCGLRTDGTLWCWGNGGRGRLGVGDTEERWEPTQVGSDSDWSLVITGLRHTCGIREDNSLWCWGRSQLGQGTRDEPGQAGSHTDWVLASANRGFTCGIRSGGTLWCWGGNEAGQLGHDNKEDYEQPRQVGSHAGWSSVAAGAFHSCGLRDDHTLWCWGSSDDGQLGHGDRDEHLTPEQVEDDQDWRSISAGGDHSCGVRSDDSLWCWGHGDHGRLGHGDFDDRLSPTRLDHFD